MEFSGIVRDQEREAERNDITKENKAGRRMIIKLFTMKIYKTKINRSKS